MFKTITSSLDPRKTPPVEDIQKIPPFIFARWLSGSMHAISAANAFNIYPDIPIEVQYNLVKAAFGGKIRFIPYPKNVSGDTQKQYQYLAEHFKISLEKAREYSEMLDSKELHKIVSMYSDMESRK